MLHEISFQSFNQRDQVQGWIYVPAAQPVGIIQLVHGFGEHSRGNPDKEVFLAGNSRMMRECHAVVSFSYLLYSGDRSISPMKV